MTSLVDRVLRARTVTSQYQPIVDIKSKRIIGAEALARATDPDDGASIAPSQLFDLAETEGRLLELDQECQDRALASFAPLTLSNPDLLLFLNFNFASSSLDTGVLGLGALQTRIQQAHLVPRRVVIELNESRVGSFTKLEAFVQRHRAEGFLIALDDVGAGYSDLRRIWALKPDILKLDRSLIKGIETDFFKQEVMRSLVGLARQIGALVLTEGVETDAEVSASLNLGADLLQGYYFAKPSESLRLDVQAIGRAMEHVAIRHREQNVKYLRSRRNEMTDQSRIANSAARELALHDASLFDQVLRRIATRSPDVECLFVLDVRGIQVTDTVMVQTSDLRRRSTLFHPATPGTDHSMKDYCYAVLEAGSNIFVTNPYVSLASGSLCRTVSLPFISDETTYVVCVDVITESRYVVP